MQEKRQTKRASCRLRCRVATGHEQVASRIIDVSEGGLCLVSPVWLKPKQKFEISIDVPGSGLSQVVVEIWHIRREKSRSSNTRIWIAGAILIEADKAYARLLTSAGVASGRTDSAARTAPVEPNQATPPKAPEPIDTIEPKVYRIRCKATGGPRTRVLSLAADSEEHARSLATRDLGAEWTVLEVRET
jgi:hypothetical protein